MVSSGRLQPISGATECGTPIAAGRTSTPARQVPLCRAEAPGGTAIILENIHLALTRELDRLSLCANGFTGGSAGLTPHL
jgi:hypothetical protein